MGLKALVGARIREARRAANLNQQAAAELAGMSQQTWASYETGKINVPLDTIDRIAQVLGQPIAFFTVADYEYKVKAAVPEAESKKGQGKRDAKKEPAH